MLRVLDLNPTEARNFFLKGESYFNVDLPQYFVFEGLLAQLSSRLDGRSLSDFYASETDPETNRTRSIQPKNCEHVNYKFLTNKDGKYSWRPFELIHPALYVSLVHRITEQENWDLIVQKFESFSQNPKIECCSIPTQSENRESDVATAISNWYVHVEQKSIELALEFEYLLHIDIADCYGSIYTHSIPWALHTKEVAKQRENRRSNLLGNLIDQHVQAMNYGQTNGIPQGSVLMDFVAEIILGYVDLQLSERLQELNVEDFQIVRYRDDYRIFTNNPTEGQIIAKQLTEILIELGMRLNTGKTIESDSVIEGSIKPDKVSWILNTGQILDKTLKEHLLIIHQHGKAFPNSGTLQKALNQFYERLIIEDSIRDGINSLISMVVDIGYKNPRTYPIVTAILSKLFSFSNQQNIQPVITLIQRRFNSIPNTGHWQIWLQRLTLGTDVEIDFNEQLCKRIEDSSVEIWNSEWLSDSLKRELDDYECIDLKSLSQMSDVFDIEEVQLFNNRPSS